MMERNGPDTQNTDSAAQQAAESANEFADLLNAGARAPQATNGLAQKEKKELEGPEHVRGAVHAVAVRAIRWGAFVLLGVIVIRVWHLVGFYDVCGFKMRWLSQDDLQSIDKMLFSSAFGGLVLSYLKDIMKSKS